MLTLPIKKKWFDMILDGEKKEEYRNVTDYYTTRLRNVWGYPAYWGEAHQVKFRNGYAKNAPEFVAECTLSMRTGKPEWGATPNVKYYVLEIHKLTVEIPDWCNEDSRCLDGECPFFTADGFCRLENLI